MKEKDSKSKFSILENIVGIVKVICAIFLVVLIIALLVQRFSNNESAIAGFRLFNVATGSMIPKYEIGDVLIVKETDIDKLEVGDDVTYLGKVGTFSDRVVTHQIIKIDETEEGKIFHTKGIANGAEDPTITGDQIYGKVIYKTIIISFLSKLMSNMTVFFIAVFIPLGILIFLQVKESMAEKKAEEDDDDDEYEDDDEEEYEDDDEEYEDDDEEYEDDDDEYEDDDEEYEDDEEDDDAK